MKTFGINEEIELPHDKYYELVQDMAIEELHGDQIRQVEVSFKYKRILSTMNEKDLKEGIDSGKFFKVAKIQIERIEIEDDFYFKNREVKQKDKSPIVEVIYIFEKRYDRQEDGSESRTSSNMTRKIHFTTLEVIASICGGWIFLGILFFSAKFFLWSLSAWFIIASIVVVICILLSTGSSNIPKSIFKSIVIPYGILGVLVLMAYLCTIIMPFIVIVGIILTGITLLSLFSKNFTSWLKG